MINQESDSPVTHVAVIGAGTMGAAMATRLLNAHFDVAVWSRKPESTRSLVELGASSHSDVRDVVANADVVLTMLPNADITVEMMFNSRGLEAMQQNAIWVQMATIGTSATESIATLVRARRPDVTLIDAPVSGSRGPAESGQLEILASGDRSRAQLLENVFDVLGKKTLWLGPVGSGSQMKLILNTWLAFQIEGAAEAASLATRWNVDSSTLLVALHDSPLVSPYALGKLERIINRDFRPDFSLDLALKDLELVGTDAGDTAAPIARAIALRWRHLVETGASGLDVSAAGMGLEESTDQSGEGE
ncbi:MAG: NAD(P)-dependent oxidoreductase [Acidimicrobiales bacterium]|jgi:3-hydroxyisobutyrate dehydrogenase